MNTGGRRIDCFQGEGTQRDSPYDNEVFGKNALKYGGFTTHEIDMRHERQPEILYFSASENHKIWFSATKICEIKNIQRKC